MKASELIIGSIFVCADRTNKEPYLRRCIKASNSLGTRSEGSVIWGWAKPGNQNFWCCMGDDVEVTLMSKRR